MLTLERVSKAYDGVGSILDKVDLTLGRKDFVYLVGGSGAGKTSLLKLLSTEDRPTSGTIQMFGYDLAKASRRVLQSIRRSIGYIPQNLQLIEELNVLENVLLSIDLAGKRVPKVNARAQALELLELFGLKDKRERALRELSGGELQRVAVARALVRAPELILADEPTGAQDRDFIWGVMEQFLRANQRGASVIVATHDREIVRRVRKRCAVLKQGRLVMEDGVCIF